jgi:outer membrane protein, heavy metal efflux system
MRFPDSYRLLGIFVSLWPTTPATAVVLTPAEAETRAVQTNPDVAAARFRIEEARGKLTGSGRKPNPELQVESTLNTTIKEGSLAFGWVQKFPRAARLQQEKIVSQTLVETAEAEVKVAERQLALQVRGLAVKMLALQEQQALLRKQQANAAELAEFANKRVATGEGSETDAVQFELEAQQIEVESLQLASEQEGVLGDLRSLLAMPPAEPLEISGTLASPHGATAVSPAARPEVLVAERNLLTAEQLVDLEKMRRREDISGGIFAGWQRSEDVPEGFDNNGMIGMRMSIPLPFWNKNEGKIQEVTASAARLATEKQALVQRLAAEAATAQKRMEVLTLLIKQIDKTLLPKATDLESKLAEFYKSGQAPLTDVLRARDKRLQLEKSRLAAVRDYHLVRSALGLDPIR